ncbi:MAG TPA: hypothetical protein VLE44_00350 [Candidatus Saccharimonadales bacterium]|nr:hypothetical protein [Candidatus Saccharimonadales bacterium]
MCLELEIMPEKGPVLVNAPEGFLVFGQKGPSPDSDFVEQYFGPGEFSVEVKSESGSIFLSSKEGVVYLAVGETTHRAFSKDLPSDKEILGAFTGIPLIEQLPEFLKNKLEEMVGDFY